VTDFSLPPVGIWTGDLEQIPSARSKEVAAELEELGYGAIWLGEVAGRDPFVHLTMLLGATSTMVGATGIASIYARDAVTMNEAAQALTEAFPERFLLGLGVSHHNIVEGVRNFDYTVGSIVPPMFDAYARVFHPASRGVGKDAVDVRWDDVAAANDRVMHAAAEWGSLTGSWQLQGQPGMPGQPLPFLPHIERLLLHRRKDGGDFLHVEIGRDPRIAGALDHRPQFSGLELLQGPGERIFDQGPVPIDAMVLVARAIVVMRAVPEVIKGQELGFFGPPLPALLRLPSGQFFKPRKKHFAVYEFKLGGHHFKDKGVFLYHRGKIRSRRDKTF